MSGYYVALYFFLSTFIFIITVMTACGIGKSIMEWLDDNFQDVLDKWFKK